MTRTAAVFRSGAPDRRPDWLEGFLAPWGEALTERLLALPRAVAAVLGPPGSGRGLLCRMTARQVARNGQYREVDLDRAPDRTRHGLASWVAHGASTLLEGAPRGPVADRVVLVRSAERWPVADLRNLLHAVGDLHGVEGLRLLVPLDPADLEGIEEDLLERALDLRCHVPAPGPEEVKALLRDRLEAEGISDLPDEAGARRALAATGGRPRALSRWVEAYLLARAVASRTEVGAEAMDDWWWRGDAAGEDAGTLRRIVGAVGADGFCPLSDPSGGALPPADPDRRREALEASEGDGEAGAGARMEEILEALSDPHPGVRKAAVYALIELGDPAAASALIPVLRSGEPEDRRAAAHALGRLAPAGARQALAPALDDPQAEVRQAAASALANLGEAQVVPLLLARLADPNPAVRMSIESALVRLAGSCGPRPFAASLDSRDVRVRTGAARMAGPLGIGAAAPVLRERLLDECAAVRRSAAASLGQLGDSEAVPVLARALLDPDPTVREAARGSLARATGDDAGGVLARLLADGDADQREAAVRALEILRPREAVGPLLELLDHHEVEVRREAASLLGRLDDPRAIEPLMRCRDKDWPEVGRVASASLVRLGVDGATGAGPVVADGTGGIKEVSAG